MGRNSRFVEACVSSGILILLAGILLTGGFFLTDRLSGLLFGFPEQNQAVAEYAWHVAVIMPTSDEGYWREMRLGMQEAARLNHIGMEFLGPRYANPEHTADQIARAVAARVDGIVCHAEDTQSVCSAIQAADQAGIPVVNVGVDVPESRRRGYVGPDPFYLGSEAGRTLFDALNVTNVAVMINGSAPQHQSTQGRYLLGLRDALAKHPHLRLTHVVYTGQAVLGAEITVGRLLAADNSIDAICCSSPRDTLSVAKVLQEQGRVNQIYLVGTGLLPETMQLLRQNVLRVTVASYPFPMGSDAINLLNDLMTGTPDSTMIISGVQVFRPGDTRYLWDEFRAAGRK